MRRPEALGLVLISLAIIPVADFLIWLNAGSGLAKASEYLLGLLILAVGTYVLVDARRRAKVAKRVNGRWGHERPVFGASEAAGREVVVPITLKSASAGLIRGGAWQARASRASRASSSGARDTIGPSAAWAAAYAGRGMPIQSPGLVAQRRSAPRVASM